MQRNMRRVVIGGTFSHLHKGHLAFLKKAFASGDEVYVGLTTDAYVRKHKPGYAEPYAKRKNVLIKRLRGFGKPFFIMPISDRYGPSLSNDFDVIVVTSETLAAAKEINTIRRKKGLKALRIVMVRRVMAENGIPISSSEIAKGRIDKSGVLARL